MEKREDSVGRDWAAWHGSYDDPASALARRLHTVRQRVGEVLDRAPQGPVIAVSLCAGQGRDLLDVLARHPRRDDVAARLVELDERNVRLARAMIDAADLVNVEAVAGDASRTDAYAGAVPADLVLVCGVFGNLADADVERTISLLPQLCAEGAHVVWTRNRQPPDLTPHVRRWFEKHGFEQVWSSPPGESAYSVGVHRYLGEPVPLERGVRLFTFVGYDNLRQGEAWPG
ncbi:class I SAM-dependent methyltransferase family protein [Spirillospora sp. NPDC047279]|uniref:class I SAM-dependent methyltransferase family protein n=1 Tax=Spirillospora sp. NPDC047279 TaxID=3155478 RepID=UPI0033D75236